MSPCMHSVPKAEPRSQSMNRNLFRFRTQHFDIVTELKRNIRCRKREVPTIASTKEINYPLLKQNRPALNQSIDCWPGCGIPT